MSEEETEPAAFQGDEASEGRADGKKQGADLGIFFVRLLPSMCFPPSLSPLLPRSLLSSRPSLRTAPGELGTHDVIQ